MPELKIAMVGAGAIGGTLAAELIEKGQPIDVMDKSRAHLEKVNKDGLFVDGLFGERLYKKIKIMDKLTGTYDVIFLAVKSTVTEQACREIVSNLKNDGVLVSLQNGINNDVIVPIVGTGRYIAGVVGYGATNRGPGHLTITSTERAFVLGRLNGEIDARLREASDILSKVCETECSRNILGDQWGKLVLNCIINPFCAIYDRTFGENVHDAKVRREMQEVLTEAITVGEKAGVKFTKLGGKYDVERLFTIHLIQDVLDITKKAISPTKRVLDLLEYPVDLFKGSVMLRMIALKHGKIKSSLWQDLQRGQRTEIDMLNGYICSMGRELGVRTPTNDKVTQEVKELEAKMVHN
jgi:2-dehydropantoate 2-reductase